MDSGSYPKFINTSPYGKDLLEGGSQDKIASTLANYIENKSSGYRLIGLEGNWGSGKSNVITILKKKLGEKYSSFIYDAWAHQEDLQRRSFLEELIGYLSTNEKDALDELRTVDNLLSKEKKRNIKIFSKLSSGLVLGFIAFLLTPIANIIAADPSFSLTYKILITACPLTIVVGIWFLGWLIDDEIFSLPNLFSVYKERNVNKIESELVFERESSIPEFKSWMRSLSDGLTKSIIIVFDNMDRLPTDKILNLWSLIHTFFSNEEDNSKYNNIWVIVPFDRAHINKAFSQASGDVDEYISKTFPIVFNIPPLILTDWQNFLYAKYIEAFGEGIEDFDLVKNLFDLYQTAITPRKVITFINELVALKLMRGNEIALRYIALYVLNKKEINANPPLILLSENCLARSAVLFGKEENVVNNIAALAYNIPVFNAEQILWNKLIEDAIVSEKHDTIIRLAQYPNFTAVLENKIRGNGMLSLDKIIFALSEINKFSKKKVITDFIWDVLIKMQINTAIDGIYFSKNYGILIENAPNIDLRKSLINYFVAGWHNQDPFDGEAYFVALDDLEKLIAGHNYNVKLVEFIKEKNVDPAQFIVYTKKAQKNFGKYKVVCKHGLEDYINSRIEHTNTEDIATFLHVKHLYNSKRILEKLELKIKNPDSNLIIFFRMVDAYKLLLSERPINVSIPDDSLLAYIKQSLLANKIYYNDLAAIRIARRNYYNASEAINLNDDDEVLSLEIAKVILNYVSYEDVLLFTITFPRRLVNKVVTKVIENEYGENNIDSLKILPHFFDIVKATNINAEILLKNLDRLSKPITEKISLRSVVPNINFFSLIQKTNLELANNLMKIAAEYISELDTEEWLNSFSDENTYNLELLGILLQRNKAFKIPENSKEAYQELLTSEGPKNSISRLMLFEDLMRSNLNNDIAS